MANPQPDQFTRISNELFAACNSIVPDAYETVRKLRKKQGKKEVSTMKGILKGMGG